LPPPSGPARLDATRLRFRNKGVAVAEVSIS
jgi:hypothetical protein